ncbi:MAG TPA: 16S rRNA (guanine(527)-N(7))-methyltransferase RsmG [Steroidobacteraceae bacterium]|nr:16S rRNA (guanine(527)-N(7))-methyltransferase RsmG [Steroidobacteraceae bacterium]
MQATTAADLRGGAQQLNVALDADMASKLLRLLDELEQWNRAFNLTGIGTRSNMVATHLLDSLAVSGDLAGGRIADLGTGAGFPGLPLAIVHPQRQFTLIDATAKKVRFVAHAARALGLANVEAVQARAESMHPAQVFDTVLARAVAPLPKLAGLARSLSRPGTRLLALKGKRPTAELAAIPSDWELLGVRELTVPGLKAERCLVTLMARLEGPRAASSPVTA